MLMLLHNPKISANFALAIEKQDLQRRVKKLKKVLKKFGQFKKIC